MDPDTGALNFLKTFKEVKSLSIAVYIAYMIEDVRQAVWCMLIHVVRVHAIKNPVSVKLGTSHSLGVKLEVRSLLGRATLLS